MLLTFKQLLDADALAAMRATLQQADWSDGRGTAGPQAATVKSNAQLTEAEPALPALRQQVLQALNRDPLLLSAALPARFHPPHFNRYRAPGQHYGWHVDGAMRVAPGGGYARADIAATLFLSDPDSYDGGELVIEDSFGRHAVKLPAGSLVLYPASSVHEVRPVTRGERLACFLFIQSMVRDAEQRRLLWEMDMQLLALRQELGETAPLVRLTGVYHNLLRRWGET